MRGFGVAGEDIELDVLQNIYAHPDHLAQRDLAQFAGLSLGMTNAVVKRLAAKGWLAIRKVNNRNIRYAVSANGIEQITRRSYRYIKRTIENIVRYRVAIEFFVGRLRDAGFLQVQLLGASDLDFIVKHASATCGLRYSTGAEGSVAMNTAGSGGEGVFFLYSESYIPDTGEKSRASNVGFLREVVSLGYRAE